MSRAAGRYYGAEGRHSVRSDDEIRADVDRLTAAEPDCLTAPGNVTLTGEAELDLVRRLCADVGPLLARVEAAEAERGVWVTPFWAGSQEGTLSGTERDEIAEQIEARRFRRRLRWGQMGTSDE